MYKINIPLNGIDIDVEFQTCKHDHFDIEVLAMYPEGSDVKLPKTVFDALYMANEQKIIDWCVEHIEQVLEGDYDFS